MNTLDTLVPILLAVSLASERLIAILKTFLPWLAEEKKTEAQEVDLTEDRPRRLIVQGIAVGTSWVTVGLSFGRWTPWDTVQIGDASYAVIALALLGSGGSALWNNVIGYTKAVKDVRTVEKASRTLAYHSQAEARGVQAINGGVATEDPGKAHRGGDVDASLARLGRQQPAI